MRGVLLSVLVIWAILLIEGCRTRSTVERETDTFRIALSQTSEPAWSSLRNTNADKPIASGASFKEVDEAAATSDDWRAIASARDDLRRRLLLLAEDRNSRDKMELEQYTSSRLDARCLEMEDANNRKCVELNAQLIDESALRVREIDTQLQSSGLNLRAKLAALKSRKKLFGGVLDKVTQSRMEALQAELDRLNENRAKEVESIQANRIREVVELRKKQRAELGDEIERLRCESSAKVGDLTKARADRLIAAFSPSIDLSNMATISVPPRFVGDSSPASTSAVAIVAAEKAFSADLAAARASMRKRQAVMWRNVGPKDSRFAGNGGQRQRS